MLMVMPLAGSWPEPRPVVLITGDRAVTVLDMQSVTALEGAGVRLAGINASDFTKLTTELVPDVMQGLDPATGKLITTVMPDYLSPAAIADVDIRGTDGVVEDQYLPARLSAASLTALLGGGGGTTTASNTNIAVTGTATINAETVSTSSVGTQTVTTLTVSDSTETGKQTWRKLPAAPGNPSADKLVGYADTNGRIVWRDNAGIERRASTKRVVTALPTDAESYLGDEIIHADTGEHRVYKGTSKGWRLASPHTVGSITERDALEQKYPGMRVHATFGYEQDHVYGTDNKWHGTQSFRWPGVVTETLTAGINDNNWRQHSIAQIVDPGFEYHLQGQVQIAYKDAATLGQIDTDISTYDPGATTGKQIMMRHFTHPVGDNTWPKRWTNVALNPMTSFAQTGTRDIRVNFAAMNVGMMLENNFSYGYDTQNWLVIPA